MTEILIFLLQVSILWAGGYLCLFFLAKAISLWRMNGYEWEKLIEQELKRRANEKILKEWLRNQK